MTMDLLLKKESLQFHPSLLKDALRSLNEENAPERGKWLKLMDAAFGALEKTRKALQDAENTLAAQRERIAALEALATTDELTGLANRRGFYEAFERELDRTERGLNQGGLLIMIDLDDFKTLNDTYGHAAGDAALQLIAKTLQREIRTMDVAARMGGDEFVLLLSNADKNCAMSRAQSLALKLNSLHLRWKGELLPVHASIGMKSYNIGDQPDSVMDAADRTMYAAKESRKRA